MFVRTLLRRLGGGSYRVIPGGINKPGSCHTFRHSLATRLLEYGCDTRTAQELPGRAGVKTTMVYTHVLNGGVKGAGSPIDV